MKDNPQINCYLINTGGVGEGSNYQDIGLKDTMGVLDSIMRDSYKGWEQSDATGLMVPKGNNSPLMHPDKLYSASEFDKKQKALDEQRAEVIDKYSGIEQKVKDVFQK